jgi:hypothetical protein
MPSFHVDTSVGVQFHLSFTHNIEKTLVAEIKKAALEFVQWVKTTGLTGRYPGWRSVPVYRESVHVRKYGRGWHYYKVGGSLRAFRVPRPEGETMQLQRSLTASFRTKLEPDIYWDTPYASHVLDRGKALTPGTTSKWPKKLAPLFSVRLRAFLKKHLRGMAQFVEIHTVADN